MIPNEILPALYSRFLPENDTLAREILSFSIKDLLSIKRKRIESNSPSAPSKTQESKKARTYSRFFPRKTIESEQSSEFSSLLPSLRPGSTLDPSFMVWDRKDWGNFISMTLEFLAASDKQTVEKFTVSQYVNFKPHWEKGSLCYFFNGRFLPSSNRDGAFWRPSRNVELGSCKVMKRYFYGKTPEGFNVRRQVWWLEKAPDFCFVEYKFALNEKQMVITMENLMKMGLISWPELVQSVNSFHREKILNTVNHLAIEMRENEIKEEEEVLCSSETKVLFDAMDQLSPISDLSSPLSSPCSAHFDPYHDSNFDEWKDTHDWESQLYQQFESDPSFFKISGEFCFN